MTSIQHNIIINMSDEKESEKNVLRNYYKYNHDIVMNMHELPLIFDRKQNPWLCEHWGDIDTAKKRENNYFIIIRRLEVLYLTAVPYCVASTFIITKNGLYCLLNRLNRKDWVTCPIYLFQEELTIAHMRILDQLKNLELCNDLPIIKLFEKQTPTNKVWTYKYTRGNETACKRFESILQLIPGKYHNGPWRPLDGLFGLYYNQITHELTDFFPE